MSKKWSKYLVAPKKNKTPNFPASSQPSEDRFGGFSTDSKKPRPSDAEGSASLISKSRTSVRCSGVSGRRLEVGWKSLPLKPGRRAHPCSPSFGWLVWFWLPTLFGVGVFRWLLGAYPLLGWFLLLVPKTTKQKAKGNVFWRC